MTRNQKRFVQICTSLFLCIVLIILQHTVNLSVWVYAGLYAVPYIIAGYNVIVKAIKSLSYKFSLDENFLMIIASIGAFALGDFAEACMVMIFYLVGELFQSIAVGKSRKSIAEIMDIRPAFARRIVGKDEEEIELEEVNVGDTLLIRAGERVPVDGVVIGGESALDMSSLTGESLPKTVKIGENVLAGAINISGVITIKATNVYENSTVAKILELVESASEKKSKSEQFITKFAKYYTPIVVGLAVLVAVIPPIFVGGWLDWLYRALNFLVVSCPCALVISVPLSYFAAVGKASSLGILVKGTIYLESYTNANTFIFDKTGTLTKGEFEISEVYPKEKRDEIIMLACCAEHESNHPIAQSILKAAPMDFEKDYQISEVFGKGVVAQKGNDEILCGNEELMQKYNIKYIKNLNVGTTVYVAKNKQFVGYINIVDKIKDEAKDVVLALKNNGYRVVMLTGDNQLMAETIAGRLGITEFYANMLPDGKVDKVEEILNNKKQNDVVVYVGDGINDSPVLMRCDIGICMGGKGSDSSIEASDIVLIRDDLKKIITAKKIAQKTNLIAKENIIFALFTKILVLLLSVFGITGLYLAIFADVGVSVLAILNSMRMLAFKEQN